MGGLKNKSAPVQGNGGWNTSDAYAVRAAASESTYNADLTPPATEYYNRGSALAGKKPAQYSTPVTRSAVVNRIPRRNGSLQAWSWGSVDMSANTGSLPFGGGMDGTVRSTMFQGALVQLHDWFINTNLYRAGYPMAGGVFYGSKAVRGTYPSFRVASINTQTSGGVGTPGMRMQPRPAFKAVQRINKYTTGPRYYNTNSQSGIQPTKGNGSSSTRGPGV